MKKLISWLENDFAPKMNVVNRNVWVVTLKDSIMQVLPFILLSDHSGRCVRMDLVAQLLDALRVDHGNAFPVCGVFDSL